MLDRDLKYRVPLARLTKLSRSMHRKAFGIPAWVTWAWIGGFIAATLAVPHVEQQLGLPWLPSGAGYFVCLLIFMGGLFFIRAKAKDESAARADYDGEATFRQEAEGVRIASREVEYFLKWPGIAQVLIEPDGIVFSHGNLFFLVPDVAFASPAERDQLVRDVFKNLSRDAQERSLPHIKALLGSD